MVKSLPEVRATFFFFLLLLLPLPYICSLFSCFKPVSKTEIQSQPHRVCAQHSKTTLFEELLVQSALFLLIL